MSEDQPNTEGLFFEVLTPLGFRVRVTQSYWDLIIKVKHPVMTGRDIEIARREGQVISLAEEQEAI